MPRKSKKDSEIEKQAIPAPEPVESEEAAAIDEASPLDEAFAEELEPVGAQAVLQAVTFRLDNQIYGLPLDVVQEIQQLVEFTPLPDTAPALVGLIDLRGIVVPGIDLRVLVGLPPLTFTLETPMVFCRVRGHVVCLIVDSVEDVVDLPLDALQAPSALSSLADRMIGMCRLPQGLVLLLDIERLVPEAALTAADEAEGGPS